MNMEECLICVEPFTKEKRRSIKCEYCDFTACKACITKWILEETKPKCMNNDCDREWTQKFLCETFGDTFVKTKSGYKVTGPEGFVAIDRTEGGAVKLVDRLEFSKANFNVSKNWVSGDEK